MEAEIRERIKVVSLFEEGKIKPFLFVWHSRPYRILRIIFSYSKDTGREKIFYFSVECSGGAYELSFNREKFSWSIERIF